MTPDRHDTLTVIVPAGHPLNGLRATLYPVSGATTYTDGHLEIVSAGTIELRKAFRDLAESLAESLSKIEQKQ